MRDAACDTGNSFTWRGERASRAASSDVKLSGHVGGCARCMRGYRVLQNSRAFVTPYERLDNDCQRKLFRILTRNHEKILSSLKSSLEN